LAGLRQRLEAELAARMDGLRVLGHPSSRAPHIACIAFPGIEADALLNAIPDLAASAGAACGTHDPSPNYVLRAMGLSGDEAAAAVRFSLSRFTTESQIQQAVDLLCGAARRLRPAVVASLGKSGIRLSPCRKNGCCSG
jgi:cysteine desulfurase